jgi:hypothetical protein
MERNARRQISLATQAIGTYHGQYFLKTEFIETYSHMHFISLAFYGMHYQFSSTFKREVERETDEKAIAHGFGLELKGFRLYRLQTASEKDKVLLETYYLSSDEISALIT